METRPIDGIAAATGTAEEGKPSSAAPVVESGESGWVDPDATRLMRVPSGEVAALDAVEERPPDISAAQAQQAFLEVPESSDGPAVLTIDPETRMALEALGPIDVAGKLSRLSALLARSGYGPERAQRLLAQAMAAVPDQPQVGLALLLELVAQPGITGIIEAHRMAPPLDGVASPDGIAALEELVAYGGALAAALTDVDARSLAQLVARSAIGLQDLPAPPSVLAEHAGALYTGNDRPEASWMAELEVLLLARAPGLVGAPADRRLLEEALDSGRLITEELYTKDPLAPRQRGLLFGVTATLIAEGGDVTEVRRLVRRARAAVGEAAPTLLVLALMQTNLPERRSSQTARREAEPSRCRRMEALVEKAESLLDRLEQDLPAGSLPDRAMLATTMGEQVLSGSEQLYSALVQIFARMGPRLRPGRLQRLRDRIRKASRRVGDPRTASAEEWLLAVEAFGPL